MHNFLTKKNSNVDSKQISSSKTKSSKYKKQYRRESMEIAADKSFRGLTGIVLVSILFVIAIAIISIIVKGIQPVADPANGIDIDYLFFGNSYQFQANKIAIGYMFVNTLWTSLFALLLATPFSVATALVITRMAPKWLSGAMSFAVIGLSAVPSVIFGLFASMAVNGAIGAIIPSVQGGTNLSVIITLAMMISPTITLVSINAIKNVDKSIEDASLALGATKTQTNLKVTLKAAAPGIFAGMMLGIGRALGEATAVSLVADPVNSGPTFQFLMPTQTLTTTMLQGFAEVDPGSLEYSLRFTMALVLLVAIILVIASMNGIKRTFIENEGKSKKIDYRNKSKEIIYTKVYNHGVESLKWTEKIKFNSYYKEDKRSRLIHSYTLDDTSENSVSSTAEHRTSILSLISKNSKSSSSTVKVVSENDLIIEKALKKSKWINSGIYAMAGATTAMLGAIVVFLLVMGSSTLSWGFLTSGYNDVQNNVYVTTDISDDETYNEPSGLSSNQVWVEEWGFALSYEVNDANENYISITNIADNSPLTQSRIISGSVTSAVEVSELGEINDLSNVNDLRLSYIFDENGTMPFVATSTIKDWSTIIPSYDSNYSWDDEKNKTALADWLNMQSTLSLSTTEYMKGIAGSLANTLLLVGMTIVVSMPLGFLAAISITEFIKSKKLKSSIQNTLSIFAGIPTLIIGLIGASIFIPLLPVDMYMWAAALTMTLIVLPTIINTIMEAMNNTSKATKNAALALGATRTRSFFTITLPDIMPTLVSTTIMAVGRVIGETAALIMVIGMVPGDAASMNGGATLSTHIYYLMKATETADYAAAAGIAIVIIILIALLFTISKQVENREWVRFGFWMIATTLLITAILTAQLWLFWITVSAVIVLLMYDITNFTLNKKYNKDIVTFVKEKLEVKQNA